MKVNVTATHIKKGVPQESKQCPIALALWEAFGLRKGDSISVDSEDTTFTKYYPDNKTLNMTLETPKRLARFIDKFDEGKKVNPFTFTL